MILNNDIFPNTSQIQNYSYASILMKLKVRFQSAVTVFHANEKKKKSNKIHHIAFIH